MPKTISPSAVSDLLNQLADFAGIDKESVEQRNDIRAVAIKILIKEFGLPLQKAYDLVWGSGSYAQLQEEVVERSYNFGPARARGLAVE